MDSLSIAAFPVDFPLSAATTCSAPRCREAAERRSGLSCVVCEV